MSRLVNDHRNLLQHSPLLKNSRVRQVVSDKWFPLNSPDKHISACKARCGAFTALRPVEDKHAPHAGRRSLFPRQLWWPAPLVARPGGCRGRERRPGPTFTDVLLFLDVANLCVYVALPCFCCHILVWTHVHGCLAFVDMEKSDSPASSRSVWSPIIRGTKGRGFELQST